MAELTSDPNDPRLTRGADQEPTKMAEAYLVMEASENPEYVRPVRQTYYHERCGAFTSMSLPLAQTYARNPWFYGSTWCVSCMMHKPVGLQGDFYWVDGGKVLPDKVGT